MHLKMKTTMQGTAHIWLLKSRLPIYARFEKGLKEVTLSMKIKQNLPNKNHKFNVYSIWILFLIGFHFHSCGLFFTLCF